jgi:branched-chain amino acid transport system ATP-binding protein
MALLELQSVTMKFGGLVANDNVSLAVEEGQIVSLIGPNGAGKTTLFNCVSGVYRPTSGRIFFSGHDITGWPPHRIARHGLVRTFQIVRTFRDMTVLENVMVGALMHTSSAARAWETAESVLDFTGLYPKRDYPGSALTTADRKRLEVARALASGPKMLMLDEAMAGLNPTERQEAVSLLLKINASGITLLLVEHVMEVIMPISQWVFVLDYGKKIAEGKPQDIVRNEQVIKAYLGEKYRAAGA